MKEEYEKFLKINQKQRWCERELETGTAREKRRATKELGEFELERKGLFKAPTANQKEQRAEKQEKRQEKSRQNKLFQARGVNTTLLEQARMQHDQQRKEEEEKRQQEQ